MSRAIRFTKAMHDAVREAVSEAPSKLDTWVEEGLTALLVRMDDASKPAEPTGLSTQDLLGLLKALGVSVALPPNPNPAWWNKIHRAIQESGLDAESGARVARAAARLRQPVAMEQIVFRITSLLAAEEARGKTDTTSGPRAGWTGRGEFEG